MPRSARTTRSRSTDEIALIAPGGGAGRARCRDAPAGGRSRGSPASCASSTAGRPAVRRVGPVRESRPRRRVAASALRRAALDRRGRPGRAGRRPARRRARRCAARSSSRWARRAASTRSSRTCCASRSPRRSASTSRGWTLPASPSGSPTATPSRPVRSCRRRSCSTQLGGVPGLARCPGAARRRRGQRVAAARSPPAVELVLEGLHLTRRLSKETVDGVTIYGS